MLRKIKQLVKIVLGKVGLITRHFEKDPCVIMWIDGGFCSQIFRYLKGQWFAVRGFKVKYDISWYDNNPIDGLGKEARDFLIFKCFPGLNFETASTIQRKRYRLLYGTHLNNIEQKFKGRYEELQPPLYSYLYTLDDLIRTENEFEELARCLNWSGLHDILGTEASNIEASIRQDKKHGRKVIGLHVRRGDMSVKTFAYGHKVLTSRYYEYVLNKTVDENSVVYVFSNGYDFVMSDVVPYIRCSYVLADRTSSVYEDMFLCSICDIQIAGQGSLGNQAYSFNENRDRKLIRPLLRDNDEEILRKYYAGSYGTVEFIELSEDMYE